MRRNTLDSARLPPSPTVIVGRSIDARDIVNIVYPWPLLCHMRLSTDGDSPMRVAIHRSNSRPIHRQALTTDQAAREKDPVYAYGCA
jgi:hypothetical protein